MLYLFTAMYCEAHPLIQQYQLKKETNQTHFQVFSNESKNMRLVITGTGMIAAAVAVASVCTKYPPNERDFLINIGICAGTSKKKDILYQHPFCEAQVITGAKPFQKEDLEMSQETCLYDMEASAIYQSGSYFFGLHRMFFLKTISDHGDFENVTPDHAQCQIAAHMESMIEFYNQLNRICKMQKMDERLFYRNREMRKVTEIEPGWNCVTQRTIQAFSNENSEIPKSGEIPSDRVNQTKHQQPDNKPSATFADNIINTLCQDLHCSQVMAASVRQHIRYCILSGIDYQTVINEMYNEQKLPCKDKREGKLRLEEFQKRLL